MLKLFMAAAGLTALVVAAPAAASTLAVDQPCYSYAPTDGARVVATGTGYTPNTPVRLQTDGGSNRASVITDAAGNFSTNFGVPGPTTGDTTIPRVDTYTLTALYGTTPVDGAATPLTVATRDLQTKPSRGKPRRRVTYSFSGLNAGPKVYGHFLFGGKLRGTKNFGAAQAPCGLRETKAAILPVSKVRYGLWTAQFDNNPNYDPNTPLQIRGTLTITRRIRFPSLRVGPAARTADTVQAAYTLP